METTPIGLIEEGRILTDISAIGLIAYDFDLLCKSLPLYIEYCEEVILGLDANRRTWMGEPFELPPDWLEQLKVIDVCNKIRIVEDRFFVEGKDPLELDTRERNILSRNARAGNWIVSIDADEFVLDFPGLGKFLAMQNDDNVCVMASLITIFKQEDSVCFVVKAKDGLLEQFAIATRQPGVFTSCRYTAQRRVLGPSIVLHYSWARPPEQIRRKLNNFGHAKEFNPDSYFKLWSAVDQHNYRCVSNFHPLVPERWPALVCVTEQDLATLTVDQLSDEEPLIQSARRFARRLRSALLRRR